MGFGHGHQNGRGCNCCCLLPNRFRSKVRRILHDAHRIEVSMLTLIINRRRVAIGLENGHILIYSSPSANPSEWELELTIDSSYVLPHHKTSLLVPH